MIVVRSNTVYRKPAMMIVFYATLIANRAVMHPWQLIHIAFLAVLKLPRV
jgi:hypothetical protein